MKTRIDFVTNSSSSSFIITNKSDKDMTSEEAAISWFSKIVEDAKDRFVLEPGESIVYECGDHPDDGYFEMFVHNSMRHYYGGFNEDSVSVEMHESHH